MGRRYFIKASAALFLLLFSVAASAQFADSGTLKRSGNRIKLDGRKLTAEEQTVLLSDIAGVDCNEAWSRAASHRKAGTVLTVAGSAGVVIGAATTVVGAMTSALGAVVGATGGALGGAIAGEEAAQQAASQGADKGAKAGEPIMTAGLITAGVGAAALATGVPLLIVHGKRMNKIVAGANQARGVQLSFAPAQDGVGLVLRF